MASDASISCLIDVGSDFTAYIVCLSELSDSSRKTSDRQGHHDPTLPLLEGRGYPLFLLA